MRRLRRGIAEALIQDPKVYRTQFDKHKVELTVVADPSIDALALGLSSAMWLVAAMTLGSGVVAVRMREASRRATTT